MKRLLHGTLAAVMAVGLTAASAQAEKKKASSAAETPRKKASAASEGKKGKKGAKNAAATVVPTSEKIAEALGDVKWGASRDDLLKKFTQKVKDKYRTIIAKTKDAVEMDRVQQEERTQLDAIRKSAVDFDGHSTGWDVSFLKGEFTHNNDESMLSVKDENSQNYYFFIQGRLWKWYKAFDASVFPAGNFATFASAVQRRFGPAKDVQGELRAGEGRRHWLEWQDKTTRLKAVDQSDFYGFFCLVFEDKGTSENLATLRRNAGPAADKRHALVEAVTGERTHDPDDAPNIADRLTGKLRQREQAPDTGSDSAESGSKQGKGSKGKKPAQAASPVNSSDDPISGLGL